MSTGLSTCFVLAVVPALLGNAAAVCDMTCQEQCATKMQECTAAMSQMGSVGDHGNSPSGAGSIADMCTSTATDQCSVVQKAVSCMEKLNAECQNLEMIKQNKVMLKGTADQLCAPQLRCQLAIQKCMCVMQAAPKSDPLAAVCTMYGNFTSCLKTLPDGCLEGEMAKALRFAQDAYGAYSTLMCDTAAGACPAAVKCLKDIGDDDDMMGGGPPMPRPPPFHLDHICGNLGVFDCLGRASSTCKIDQGTVTMAKIKEAATDICQGDFSNALDFNSPCPQFQTCVTTFQNVQDLERGTQRGPGELPDKQTILKTTQLMAQAMRTGFWCDLMQHYYQCAIENADVCEIDSEDVTMATQKKASLASLCVGAATVPPPTDTGAFHQSRCFLLAVIIFTRPVLL